MSDSGKAVFLSYASQDAAAARRICHALRAAGIDVWFDQSELRGGDAWDQKIRKQIKECALFVPIISANTQARREGYFRIEWKLAAQRTHAMADGTPFVMPLVIDDTQDADALVPEEFCAVQWTRPKGGEVPPSFCERVKLLLDGTEVQRMRSSPTERGGVAAAPGKSLARKPWLAPVLLVVVAAVAVALWQPWQPSQSTASAAVKRGPRISSLAVKPLDDFSSDRSQAYLSDGVTEALCAALGSVGSLRVPGRTSVMRFKGSQKSIQEIARELGVDAIVEGSVQLAANRMLITVRLVEAAGDRHLWSANYERDLGDFFNVQREVARAVATEVSARLTPSEQRRLSATRSFKPEAVAAYLKGVHLANQWTIESTKAAIQHFQNAIELESDFAAAHAGLAVSYTVAAYIYLRPSEAFRRAESAAKEAVRLDGGLADAHSALGAAQLHLCDWASAERSIKHALSLNERNAMAHDWYAWLLIAQERADEAMAHMRRALELEPQSALFNPDWAWILLYSRRYAEAAKQSEDTLKLYRDNVQALQVLAWARMRLGDQDGAIAAILDAQRADDSPTIRADLAQIHALAGRNDVALRILGELESERSSAQYFIRGDLIGHIHLVLGRKDEALTWFERAVAENSPEPLWARVIWKYDPVRSDPRFSALMRKMGLDK